MTDRTQPDSASTTSSTHIIRYALELGLLWIDGDGRDKVREALDALDTLEAQLASIGAGGVSALMGAASAGSDGVASLPLPGAQEAVAWMRRDGMRAMVADEKDGWIAEGRANIVEDYTKPLYAAPQPALPAGWVSVKDRLPPCRDDQDYIGINSAGFAGIFNAVADIAGNVYCMMETAEESVSIMSDLDIWKPFIRPLPASPTIEGESK